MPGKYRVHTRQHDCRSRTVVLLACTSRRDPNPDICQRSCGKRAFPMTGQDGIPEQSSRGANWVCGHHGREGRHSLTDSHRPKRPASSPPDRTRSNKAWRKGVFVRERRFSRETHAGHSSGILICRSRGIVGTARHAQPARKLARP